MFLLYQNGGKTGSPIFKASCCENLDTEMKKKNLLQVGEYEERRKSYNPSASTGTKIRNVKSVPIETRISSTRNLRRLETISEREKERHYKSPRKSPQRIYPLLSGSNAPLRHIHTRQRHSHTDNSYSPTLNSIIKYEKAVITIQRAYRKHRNRMKHQSLNKNKTQILSPTDSAKSQRSGRHLRRHKETVSSYSKMILLKDYLREGSLFFADRESVIVFGGIDPHSKYGDGRNTGRNIFRYNSEINQWELVGELPQPRHHHAVAFLKGRVYLAGGTDPRDDEKGKSVVVGTVWSFEPTTRAWYKETEMQTPRKNFGLIVMNGKLLAIGGQDKDGRIISTVERYDTATGVWEYIAPLNEERTGAAAARYRDTVWVAGGMTGSRKNPLTSSVESYDSKVDAWVQQAPLRFPRCFACLFAMNDVLYLIGGAGRSSEKERTTSSCNAIDVWSRKEEEWKLHFAMSIPRHGHAVAYLGTQILIIGGVTTAYLRALTDIECFCCERKTWVKGLANLPVPLSGHGAVTLPPASLI